LGCTAGTDEKIPLAMMKKRLAENGLFWKNGLQKKLFAGKGALAEKAAALFSGIPRIFNGLRIFH